MPTTEFAEKLRRLRKDAGLTQAELAEKLEISRSSVSGYEKGLFIPDIQALAAAAEFFNVSADWLIGRPGAVRSTDPNMAAVCEYTGLSEAAVDALHRTAHLREDSALKGISSLLEYDVFMLDLFICSAFEMPDPVETKAEIRAQEEENRPFIEFLRSCGRSYPAFRALQEERLKNPELLKPIKERDLYKFRALELVAEFLRTEQKEQEAKFFVSLSAEDSDEGEE